MHETVDKNIKHTEQSAHHDEAAIKRIGMINKIRGSIIDVRFSGGSPKIQHKLTINSEDVEIGPSIYNVSGYPVVTHGKVLSLAASFGGNKLENSFALITRKATFQLWLRKLSRNLSTYFITFSQVLWKSR